MFYDASFLELPWDQPSESCQEYSDWLQKITYLPPWKKIQPMPLSRSQRLSTAFSTHVVKALIKISLNFSFQVCCLNYYWPVQTHASTLQQYRKTAGSLKASHKISYWNSTLSLVFTGLICMYVCVCVRVCSCRRKATSDLSELSREQTAQI